MKQLIIVESPSKAKTIEKYLGGDIDVMASKGHVCDLPQRSLGIDIEGGFIPQYIVTPEKEETIKKLKAAVAKHDKVYLATDPDREGEAISWHLKNTLKIDEEIVRIEFNEISPKAVKEAMLHPRKINEDLVDSQQARRVLDRLVGYKISPILSRKIKQGSSAGRVQSAALKMIVDREKEIRDFKPEEYWNIFAMLLKDGAKKSKSNLFKAALNDLNGKKIKIETAEQAENIKSKMLKSAFCVDDVKKSVVQSRPAPPFTTSTMQQEASHKLNMTADRTSRVAQQLYEGVNIDGEGLQALITYIRTDSVRVSPDFAKHTLEFVSENYGNEYAPKSQNIYKTSANAQDAHEAIRPISVERTPKSIEGKVERDQYRLYKLIYERFLASQMTNAQFNTMKVHILGESDEAKLGFVVKGRSVKFKGFTAVYSATVENDEENDEMDTMPDLNKDEKLDLDEVVSEQKFTKPPARYSDATLVKGMEENGIGRPSTYASIISVLAKREYTEKIQKTIAPTALGEAICAYMEENFPDIMNLSFTARLEGALDKVADGGQQWQGLIAAFYPRLAKFVERAYKKVGGATRVPDEESDVVCDKCGAKMVIKDGKYGKFLACPNYPKCKNIKKIVQVVGKCPKCGGDVQKKSSKSGKTFYGCSNYPKCDFVSWDIPAPYLCPDCGNIMKVQKKDDKTFYVCTSKTCNHKETLIENSED